MGFLGFLGLAGCSGRNQHVDVKPDIQPPPVSVVPPKPENDKPVAAGGGAADDNNSPGPLVPAQYSPEAQPPTPGAAAPSGLSRMGGLQQGSGASFAGPAITKPSDGNVICAIYTAGKMAALSRSVRSRLCRSAVVLTAPQRPPHAAVAAVVPQRSHAMQLEAAVQAARRAIQHGDESAADLEAKQQLLLVVHSVGGEAASLLGCTNAVDLMQRLRSQLLDPMQGLNDDNAHEPGRATVPAQTLAHLLLSTAAPLFGLRLPAHPYSPSPTQQSTFTWRGRTVGDGGAPWSAAAHVDVAVEAAYVDLGDGSLQACLVLVPSWPRHISPTTARLFASPPALARCSSRSISCVSPDSSAVFLQPAESVSRSEGCADALYRQLRCQTVLDEVPLMATLMEVDGAVLYQNEASLAYWGRLVEEDHEHAPQAAAARPGQVARTGAPTSEAVLEALFSLTDDVALLDQLQDTLDMHCSWRRVLQVPRRMSVTLWGGADRRIQRPGVDAGGGPPPPVTLALIDQFCNSRLSSSLSSPSSSPRTAETEYVSIEMTGAVGPATLPCASSGSSGAWARRAHRNVSFSRHLVQELGCSPPMRPDLQLQRHVSGAGRRFEEYGYVQHTSTSSLSNSCDVGGMSSVIAAPPRSQSPMVVRSIPVSRPAGAHDEHHAGGSGVGPRSWTFGATRSHLQILTATHASTGADNASDNQNGAAAMPQSSSVHHVPPSSALDVTASGGSFISPRRMAPRSHDASTTRVNSLGYSLTGMAVEPSSKVMSLITRGSSAAGNRQALMTDTDLIVAAYMSSGADESRPGSGLNTTRRSPSGRVSPAPASGLPPTTPASLHNSSNHLQWRASLPRGRHSVTGDRPDGSELLPQQFMLGPHHNHSSAPAMGAAAAAISGLSGSTAISIRSVSYDPPSTSVPPHEQAKVSRAAALAGLSPGSPPVASRPHSCDFSARPQTPSALYGASFRTMLPAAAPPEPVTPLTPPLHGPAGGLEPIPDDAQASELLSKWRSSSSAAADCSDKGTGPAKPVTDGCDDHELETVDERPRSTSRRQPAMCWHEVHIVPLVDPVSYGNLVLLLQTDITSRAQLEASMTALTESQLTMLEQMFPRHILEYMVGGQEPGMAPDLRQLATSHTGVTILFTDIVGFTTMSKEVAPAQVMGLLGELFSQFDALVDEHGCYKVETAGDCYIAAGGLMCIDPDGFCALDPEPDVAGGAQRVFDFARALLETARTVRMPHNGQPTVIRIGIHTGPVVTGLIGSKLPKFSLFGDTMNTSSRMESTAPHGCIQVSAATYALLPPAVAAQLRATGGVEVKGKGRMETYIWDPAEHCERRTSGAGTPMARISEEAAVGSRSGGGRSAARAKSLRRGPSRCVSVSTGLGESSLTNVASQAASALMQLAAAELGAPGRMPAATPLTSAALLQHFRGTTVGTSRNPSEFGSAKSTTLRLGGRPDTVISQDGSACSSARSRRSGRSHVSTTSVLSTCSHAGRRHPLLNLLRARVCGGGGSGISGRISLPSTGAGEGSSSGLPRISFPTVGVEGVSAAEESRRTSAAMLAESISNAIAPGRQNTDPILLRAQSQRRFSNSHHPLKRRPSLQPGTNEKVPDKRVVAFRDRSSSTGGTVTTLTVVEPPPRSMAAAVHAASRALLEQPALPLGGLHPRVRALPSADGDDRASSTASRRASLADVVMRGGAAAVQHAGLSSRRSLDTRPPSTGQTRGFMAMVQLLKGVAQNDSGDGTLPPQPGTK